MHDGRCRVSLPTSDGGRLTHDVSPDQLRVHRGNTEEARNLELASAVFEKEDLNKVASLLAAGLDPNGCVDMQDGTTASMLFLASMSPKPKAQLAILLLVAGADPKAVSPSGWSLAKALRTRKLDASFQEDLENLVKVDCDTLLEECRTAGRSGSVPDSVPDSGLDKIEIASFLRNVQNKQDLLHAATMLCDFTSICQLLACHHDAFDLNAEIEMNGQFMSPLSLVYYSLDRDSDLCLHSLLAARADPHMPSMGEVLADTSACWTLAGAARKDEQFDLVKILKQIPLRNRTIAHPEAAAKWIWSRIRRVEVTTDSVKVMLDYILPCMFLDELVQEVLAMRAESREDEEPFAVLYWQLADQLLCLSAQHDDDKAVAQLLGANTDVESHDDSKR